ncbi:MAG: hypothetical protein IJH34_01190 [Romboutsia sp.]|nr:hypothetical protein [Romboutsia sp.]
MDEVKSIKKYEKESNEYFESILKMIVYSLVGIIIFFIPININNELKTILYHISDKIQMSYNDLLEFYIIIFISLMTLKDYKRKSINKIIIFLNFLSILILIDLFYNETYLFIKDENIILILKSIIFDLITLLPLSSIFIPFILEYGLLEIVESYFHPITKKLFKISGKSFLNLLIFLFTDCFCGCYVANLLYSKGKLRLNELYIVIANFSIMSLPMMIYTYDELNLKKASFFIVIFIIIIISNIILCRLYPLNKIKKSYAVKSEYKETIHKKDKLKKAVNKYLNNKNKNKKKLCINILDNLETSISISIKVISNIVIIFFLLETLLSSETAIYALSKIFYPIINLLNLDNVYLLSESIIRMFYNNIMTIEWVTFSMDYSSRFLIGVLLALGGISLSSNIVYLISSSLKIDLKNFILIYFERIVIILLVYSFIYYYYIGYIT